MCKSKINSLSPIMNADELLRVGGRLEASRGLTPDQRNQIILPTCRFTTLIVRELHLKHLHVGQQSLIAIVKQKFWPLKARSLTRKIVRECVTCFRVKPRFYEQFMANLPPARVNQSLAFVNVAVDYTGFYLIRTSLTIRYFDHNFE